MSRLLLAVTVFAFVELAKGQVVNGNWGSWSAYGSCSVTCGNGQYTRTRQCDNPAASGGGTDCAGDDAETNSCWTSTCYPSQLGNLDKNCGADNYGCVSGVVNCVTSARRCDGTVDCSDGSDEDLTHAGCVTTCSGADSMTMSVMLVASMWIFMKMFKQ
ncbi:adhesion G protein-coupled receptor B1-like [Mytilus californianus]|uniref:adhesion G protein-coupled receptor B1-like n=1 Tax=Mytilus californianus TaxID=6549 RepID=UPI0022482196|nr:adhesion G protein-coupled receptor B1-like [Mytilus californianus]